MGVNIFPTHREDVRMSTHVGVRMHVYVYVRIKVIVFMRDFTSVCDNVCEFILLFFYAGMHECICV